MVKDRLKDLQTQSKNSSGKSDEMKPLKNNDNNKPFTVASVNLTNYEVKFKRKVTDRWKKKDETDENKSTEDSDFSKFMDRFADLSSQIDKIVDNVNKIKVLFNKSLNTAVKCERDESEMERLASENQSLGRNIQSMLKKEQSELNSESKDNNDRSRIEHRMKQTQISCQSQRFLSAWNDYNECQVQHRDKYRMMLIKRTRITNADLNEEQIEEMLDKGQLLQVFGAGQLEQEREARAQLNELEQRHSQLIRLEESLVEVNNMFTDIAMLVQSQGEMINSIEKFVISAKDDVESGKDQLHKARQSSKTAIKRKIICFSLLAVLMLIVVLVVLAEFGLFG